MKIKKTSRYGESHSSKYSRKQSKQTHSHSCTFLSRAENWGFLKDYDPLVRQHPLQKAAYSVNIHSFFISSRGLGPEVSSLLREIRRNLRSSLKACPSSQTHSPAPRAGRWAAGWTRPWGEPSHTWISSSRKARGRRSWRMSCSRCRDLRTDPSR